MKRSFGVWAKAECDHCGFEFQVTRTSARVIEGDVLCGDCHGYEKAYDEGYEKGLLEGLAAALDEVRDAGASAGTLSIANDSIKDMLSKKEINDKLQNQYIREDIANPRKK